MHLLSSNLIALRTPAHVSPTQWLCRCMLCCYNILLIKYTKPVKNSLWHGRQLTATTWSLIGPSLSEDDGCITISHQQMSLRRPVPTADDLSAWKKNEVHCNVVTPPPLGKQRRSGVLWRSCLCLCVCLSVRDHIFGTARPIFTKFLCMLSMVVARSCSGGVVIC